jgi:hypothetical protein
VRVAARMPPGMHAPLTPPHARRRMQSGATPSDVAAGDVLSPFDSDEERAKKINSIRAVLQNTKPLPRMEERRPRLPKRPQAWDFFLSHYQKNGGAQMGQLYADLKLEGRGAWYDKTETPNLDGMKLGVAKSDVFLLYLTRGVFTRPFCLLEIREALRLRKPMILLREMDTRYEFKADDGTIQPAAASIEELKAEAPEDMQALFTQLVALENKTESYLREGVMKKILARDTPQVVKQ